MKPHLDLGHSHILSCCNHRIIEWFGLEGTFDTIQFQSPCYRPGPPPLDKAAQSTHCQLTMNLSSTNTPKSFSSGLFSRHCTSLPFFLPLFTRFITYLYKILENKALHTLPWSPQFISIPVEKAIVPNPPQMHLQLTSLQSIGCFTQRQVFLGNHVQPEHFVSAPLSVHHFTSQNTIRNHQIFQFSSTRSQIVTLMKTIEQAQSHYGYT